MDSIKVMNKKYTRYKFLLSVLGVFLVSTFIYLILINFQYPSTKEWSDWFELKVSSPNDDYKCFNIGNPFIFINSKEQNILFKISFNSDSHCKNISPKKIRLVTRGINISKINVNDKNYGQIYDINIRNDVIDFDINFSKMDLTDSTTIDLVESSNINVNLYYQKKFFNYYDVKADNPLKFDNVVFASDISLFNGYLCEEGCFLTESPSNPDREYPTMYMHNENLLLKRFEGGNRIEFRYAPKRKLVVSAMVTLQGLVIGIFSGLIVLAIDLIYIKSKEKNKRKKQRS